LILNFDLAKGGTSALLAPSLVAPLQWSTGYAPKHMIHIPVHSVHAI